MLAHEQAGVITRAQALAAGSTPKMIEWRLWRGWWVAGHPGVYFTFTGPPPPQAVVWAAVLACGPGAAASHITAARLAGLVVPGAVPMPAPVHVVIPWERRIKAPQSVVLHRRRELERAVLWNASPPRVRIESTVADLVAEAGTPGDALAIVAQAVQQRLTTPARLAAELERRPRLRWRRPVLDVLDDVATGAFSLLEVHYLRRVERAHGLPRGVRQQRHAVGGRTQFRDVYYRAQGVVAELDGRVGHSTVFERHRDMQRDNWAAAEGLVSVRLGWVDVDGTPCATAGQMGAILGHRGWTGTPCRCGPRCAL